MGAIYQGGCLCEYDGEQKPYCGDGEVIPPEQCEPGLPQQEINKRCTEVAGSGIDALCVDCMCEWCGDGVRNGNEQCDGSDADACGGAGCNEDCTCGGYCGDGILAPSEECETHQHCIDLCAQDPSLPFCEDGIDPVCLAGCVCGPGPGCPPQCPIELIV